MTDINAIYAQLDWYRGFELGFYGPVTAPDGRICFLSVRTNRVVFTPVEEGIAIQATRTIARAEHDYATSEDFSGPNYG